MAELIKKNELVEALTLSHTAHANNSREESLLNRDLRIVMEQPTTTEAEIRAKAIDEFLEEAMRKLTELELSKILYTVTDCKIALRDVAEQLKENEEC